MCLPTLGRRTVAITLSVAAMTMPIDAPSAQGSCSSPRNPFLNPFSKESAHHRPIGSGAEYASSSHPATRDWLKAKAFGVNVGGPWGVSVAATDATDPMRRINGKGPNIYGLPISIRLPKEGFRTKIGYNQSGTTDGIAVIYDYPSGQAHQLRRYDWNDGMPVAGQYRTWNVKGLGHGIRPNDRLGTSASGVAALFGILRGEEVNTPGRKIEHALQMVLPRHPGCNIMLSREIVLPAVARDSSATSPGNNTGNIPYGGLLALLPTVNLTSLGLSEPGKRLAETIRDYGIYAVDGGGCEGGAIRADQHISEITANLLRRDIRKIYPYIRMVLNNNVLANPVAGGGSPRAPNCANIG